MTRNEAEQIVCAAAFMSDHGDMVATALGLIDDVDDRAVRATLAAVAAGLTDFFELAQHVEQSLPDMEPPDLGWEAGWILKLANDFAFVTRAKLAAAAAVVRDGALRDRLAEVLATEGTETRERAEALLAQRDTDHRLSAVNVWDTSAPMPERDWIMPGWIPAGRVTLLTGTGGGGKSLLVLQMMVSVASSVPPDDHQPDPHRWPFGRAIRDRRAPTTDRSRGPGRAVFLSWEDESNEVLRRLHWIDADGKHLGDRLHFISLEGQGPLWGPMPGQHQAVAADALRLGHTVSRHIQSLNRLHEDTPVRLIVVDPAAGAFGSDENSRALVRQFLGWMSELARRTRAAVVIVAHPPKNPSPGNEYSGSTDWRASVRSMIALEVADTRTGEPVLNKDGSERTSSRTGDTVRAPALAWRLRRAKGSYAGDGTCAWMIRECEQVADRVVRLRWQEASREDAAAHYTLSKEGEP